MKSALPAVWVFGLASALFAAGLATFWWASELMRWLIHMVGEEWALGTQNVVRLDDGGKLLTNPTGMIFWTLPFYLLGAVNISGAVTLAWLWYRRAPDRPGDSDAS